MYWIENKLFFYYNIDNCNVDIVYKNLTKFKHDDSRIAAKMYFAIAEWFRCSLFKSAIFINCDKLSPLEPEFIDPVFTKTSPKRSFSLNRKRAFWLVFAKTGSIISGPSLKFDQVATFIWNVYYSTLECCDWTFKKEKWKRLCINRIE